MRTILLAIVLLMAGCTAPPPAALDQGQGHGSVRLGGPAAPVSNYNATPPKDATYVSAMTADSGKVDSAGARNDTAWGNIYAKADAKGFHYNINQPAKLADASMDEWSLVFAPYAPYRAEDIFYACGPSSTVLLQLYDPGAKLFLYDGKISEVPLC